MFNDQNNEINSELVTTSQLNISTSLNFLSWLDEEKLSIAMTTYQVGKLFLLGLKPNGELSFFERTFDHCTGLCPTANGFYMSSKYQIWRFENILTKNEIYNDYDKLYIPQTGNTTGSLNTHDMAVDKNGRLIFVNTLFGCLAALSDTHSFTYLWKPKFIKKLVAEDCCHLNGLAMKDGFPAYVTAIGDSNIVNGWRDNRANSGIVIDINSDEIIASGLSMPHSPRWYKNKLWLCNSGTGEFGYIEIKTGRFIPITFCAGYMRGLYFHGDYALIGVSNPRHDKTFNGLPLNDNLKLQNLEPNCGMYVIDLRTGNIIHWIYFKDIVYELYDIIALPGVRSPMAIGFKTDEINYTINIDRTSGYKRR